MRASVVVLVLAAALPGQIKPEELSGLRARAIGPAGTSGRVTAIDAVVADPDVLWVGAASGGVWRSDNGGVSWRPVFDKQRRTASIGAVAVFQQNPDVVWVGTGEGNPRNSVSVGHGVYRTRDAGETWQHLGLADTERIHRIVLHPTDPDTAWVAALGPLWSEGSDRGVYKTTDGGATWRRVLGGGATRGAADLVADPRNPDKLFAALWEHRRTPYSFHSGGAGSGLHVSIDGGETWQPRGPEHGLPEGPLGRIGIAVAPSDPRVVYALVEAERSALYRSADGGRTFVKVNDKRDVAARPFYFCDLRVDPERPDRVYNLQTEVLVSDDGGANFETLVSFRDVHPDHHAWWIHPGDASFIVDGNDGGVAISRDRGATWRFVANLPLAQFYEIAVDRAVPYHVYGGLQDNGSWRGPSAVWESGGIRNHHWQEVGHGDGFGTVAIDPKGTVGYAMSQEGYLHRWDLRTGERRSIRPAAGEVPLRFHWNAPLALHPTEADTVFFGSQFVHRSADRGETWQIISPDLTTNNQDWQQQTESGGLTRDVTGAENHTTLVEIAPSPFDGAVLWVGTDDGRVQVTRNGGKTWTAVEGEVPGLPDHTWVADIEPSRFVPDTAYVVFDDHRRGNSTPYVYRASGFGAQWQRLSTGDLHGHALSLVQDLTKEQLLFVGTEHGLWFSLDEGDSWTPLQHGIPPAPVRALVVHPDTGDLVIGTHGRGAFVLDDLTPLRMLTPAMMDAALEVFTIRAAVQHRVQAASGSRFPGAGEFCGDDLPYGALITFVADGTGLPLHDERPQPDDPHVVVEVTHAGEGGARVARFERRAVRGVNRISWNLRRDAFRRPLRPGDDLPDPDQAPHGPEVLPGTYTVRLELGGAFETQVVEVLPDPRVAHDAEARQRHDTAVVDAGGLLEQLTDAVERLQDARADLQHVVAKIERRRARAAAGAAPHGELLDAAKDLGERLDALEARYLGPRDAQGVLPRDHAGAKVSWALSSLLSSWSAPTAAQLIDLEAARRAVAELQDDTTYLFDVDVAAFRTKVAAAGLGVLAPR